MSVILCAMLWARPGREAGLVEYEDAVLRLLGRHGGQRISRVRSDGSDGHPFELQVLEFPDQTAVDAFVADPDRLALSGDRDAVIARTEVFPVSVV